MSTIARLKITLADIEPRVTRRVEVPFDIRLDRLHLVVQAAMGWTNSHLHEFRLRGLRWGAPDRYDMGGLLDARKARLIDLIESTGAKKLDYTYDFGDDWRHEIKIERIETAAPGTAYPRLLDATGRCPPEDVGGYPGYMDMLDAKADPAHPRRAELEDWIDLDAFDPKVADKIALERAVQALAKRWARKPAARRTPSA